MSDTQVFYTRVAGGFVPLYKFTSEQQARIHYALQQFGVAYDTWAATPGPALAKRETFAVLAFPPVLGTWEDLAAELISALSQFGGSDWFEIHGVANIVPAGITGGRTWLPEELENK